MSRDDRVFHLDRILRIRRNQDLVRLVEKRFQGAANVRGGDFPARGVVKDLFGIENLGPAKQSHVVGSANDSRALAELRLRRT